jgi:hypothetical protein
MGCTMLFYSSPNVPSFWHGHIAAGLLLVASGIVIIAFPEILAYLLALILILFGTSLIGTGWRLRRSSRRQRGEYEVIDM